MNWRVGVALVWAASGCGGEEPRAVALPVQDACAGRDQQLICNHQVALTCAGGKTIARDDCAARSLSCVAAVGCRACDPDAVTCQENARYRCNADGSALTFVEQCTGDLKCAPTGCFDLCAGAAADRSYLGCEYWPVFTLNSALDSVFRPAVSIGNGNLVPAHVVIEKAGVQVVTVDVPANSATTVQLDFDPALKAAGASSLVRAGAYHLRADVPVTVHQFNPLLFEIPQKCQDSGDGAGAQPCYSYTNDASLLFPASALATDPEDGDPGIQYLTASRATWLAGPEQGSLHGFSGFVAVVAVGPGPAVVRVTTSANTLPSAPGAEPIPALAPGDTFQCTLAPGDVLQLASAIPSACTGMQSGTPSDPTPAIEYCDPGAQFDLTRTEVSADGPIEVISGHDCTNVPFDRPACDHLEDAMLPLRAWGKSVVVTRPHVNGDDSYVLRVVSGADGNTISFDPAVQAPITLGRAQSFELTADEPLFVQGTGPLMAAQYLVGQGQPTASVGDPSLALAVPVDQYRRTYNFISPSTYTSNYVDIVAATGDLVTLDGAVISLFQPIGQSRFSVVTVPLQQAGAHELRGTGAAGLGVMLYGVAYYTSYMLPGGLDLRTLTVSGF